MTAGPNLASQLAHKRTHDCGPVVREFLRFPARAASWRVAATRQT
jgi:hypothetical protein